MNISVPLQGSTEVKKKLFKLKPLRRDGLLLNIHYSKSNAKIRLSFSSFNKNGRVLAVADNEGHIYVVDFFCCKFWSLPKLESCTLIKFSPFNGNEIFTGGHNGDIHILDFDSGFILGRLEGHKLPVKTITFAEKSYLMSASQYEAIIWDSETNSKLQMLALDKNSVLKFVGFIPVSNNILACFKDDVIQIWNNDKFEPIKQLVPINWNNFSVRTVIFSRNGHVMIVAGLLPTLAIFLLDNWKLRKLISLPEYIISIKSVIFVPQTFDGGCNKILAILSGHGTLYFYDLEQNIIVSELTSKCEIKKIECCPNGTYIACTMCSGEVELYNLSQYITPHASVTVEKAKKVSDKVKLRDCKERIAAIKSEINDILEEEKLKAILKEFGEYPEDHRMKIWEKLLQIPNNIDQYNSVIDHTTLVAFKDLYTQYPLMRKTLIKSLKKLMNNIVTWCPFFAQVEYLPVLAFPFVKVFQNRPVACFEVFCTILLNWCQHWFEYYPLAPVNILAMIENMLMEHDPDLLHHFSTNEINSNLYAWPLLETVFSEVLTGKEWLQFWDHVLTNEPSFLICAVVAYNITHKDILYSLRTISNVEFFFHNQNPNNTKKFLQKTYYIMNNTSEKIHPRQYLEKFKSIEVGNYPLFLEYPKTAVDVQVGHMRLLDKELVDIETYEERLLQEAKKKWEACECDKKLEERRRQDEMKQVCLDKMMSGMKKVQSKREELQHLKEILGDEEQKIFSDSRKKLPRGGDDLLLPHCQNCWTDQQNDAFKKYTKLMRFKHQIEEFVDRDDGAVRGADVERLLRYKKKLEEQIDKVKKTLTSRNKLKQLNLAANIVAVENLIKDVEQQLHADVNPPAKLALDSTIELLKEDTKALEDGITKILNQLQNRKTSKKRLHKSNKEQKPSDVKEDKSSSEGGQKSVRFSKSS